MSHGALQTSRIGPADTDSPVIYSIHHHVYEHINQNYGNRLRYIKFTFLFSVMIFFFWRLAQVEEWRKLSHNDYAMIEINQIAEGS